MLTSPTYLINLAKSTFQALKADEAPETVEAIEAEEAIEAIEAIEANEAIETKSFIVDVFPRQQRRRGGCKLTDRNSSASGSGINAIVNRMAAQQHQSE